MRTPTFPRIDLSRFDLSRLDLTRLDLGAIEFPKVEFPKVEFPKVEFPKVEFPKVDLPDLEGLDEKVTAVAKDAAYITIGLAVLALQSSQVRRRELTQQLGERLGVTREQVEEFLKSVETQVRDAVKRTPLAA